MVNVTTPKIPKWLTPATVLAVVAGIVLLVAFGSSVYVVEPMERAVVTRFGRYLTTKEPGMHSKLPFGIDRHYIVKTEEVQTEQFGFRTVKGGVSTTYSDGGYEEESSMLTGDLNIVDVEWIIQYRVVDPKAWLFNVQEKQQTIRDISQSVMNLLVGDRSIMEVFGPERTAIETEGAQRMNEILKNYNLGIDIITVKLQNIVAPKGVQEAFEDVNKAIQDMNRLINEGKEAYSQEIPKAKGEADRVIQVAEGYATERVNEAEGDVARFNSVYEEYRKAPDVTRRRLYYEMIEEVFGDKADTKLIDKQFRNFLPMMNVDSGKASSAPATGGKE